MIGKRELRLEGNQSIIRVYLQGSGGVVNQGIGLGTLGSPVELYVVLEQCTRDCAGTQTKALDLLPG